MISIGIVGSGIAGLHLALYLQKQGIEATVYSDRSADEIRGGRVGEAALRPIEVPPELARPWTVEADFIAAIREGAPVEPSFADGLRYMEFTEAVYRSAESGGVVPSGV